MTNPLTTPPTMTMVQFHLGILSGQKHISADIEVAGLGKVTIRDCISFETINKISEEVLFALRQKMGQQP